MTRARITAAQATRPPKGMRMHRGTVTAVSPLTVQIAGGGAVTGLAVPGQRYTVGDAVLVAVQEPAVGPVYPLTPTAPADLTVYAKTTDLVPYAKTTDLAPYAKTADLSVYAKSSDLPATITGTITYAGTGTGWTGAPSILTRYGPLVSLKLQENLGATAPAAGATIATLPTGFRPAGNVWVRAILFNNGWNQGADLEIRADGSIVINGSTVPVAAGHGVFLSTTYTAA